MSRLHSLGGVSPRVHNPGIFLDFLTSSLVSKYSEKGTGPDANRGRIFKQPGSKVRGIGSKNRK